jgi:hypothetical protein
MCKAYVSFIHTCVTCIQTKKFTSTLEDCHTLFSSLLLLTGELCPDCYTRIFYFLFDFKEAYGSAFILLNVLSCSLWEFVFLFLNVYSKILLIFIFIIFLFSTGDQIWGLIHSRQVLYYWATPKPWSIFKFVCLLNSELSNSLYILATSPGQVTNTHTHTHTYTHTHKLSCVSCCSTLLLKRESF